MPGFVTLLCNNNTPSSSMSLVGYSV
eukprot:COSAG01_NODE_57250_length_313_cov_0.971963_2_plen_25_part_01